MTDRYAVVGNPVAQSKSPRIHAAFARQTGQAMEYGTILAPRDGFAAAVQQFRSEGGRGLNVTVPFKLDAFAFATALSDRARSAGAVNTLKFDGASVLGDNTDGAGLVADITDRLGLSLRGKRVLLLGAGGAARGVLLPMLAEHPELVVVVNRTIDKATALVERFASSGPIRGGGYGEFDDMRFDIVINATSASLQGMVPPLSPRAFADGSLAYDMVYAD